MDDKLVGNTFARLLFQDGQTNAIASLKSRYVMISPKQIIGEVIGGSSGDNIKKHFKNVGLEEGP